MNDTQPEPGEHDAIAAHDRIAKFYHYRTPYGESFFEKFAARVELGTDAMVLDLCCGTGAVAVGMAPHCKSVVAVDGAPAMIAHAKADPRVAYRLFDIGSPGYAEWIDGQTFDLITIGMGVHWLSDPVLNGLRRNLRPGGRFAILATGFSGQNHNPWFPEYQRIRQSLTPRDMRDWTGEKRLTGQGYVKGDLIHQTFRTRVGPIFLANHLLSFSAEAENVEKNYDALLVAMEKRLKPHLSNGTQNCFWTSSARLFFA